MTIGSSMNVDVAGTPGTGVTALESGQGTLRKTTLIVAAGHVLVTTPDNESLAQGALIYTFPAGVIIVHRVYGDVGLEINDAANIADTPEIGLGTVIGAGAIAVLNGTTMEDIWGPHVVAGCDTGADATDAGQFVSVKDFFIANAGVHTVYLNCADAWANNGNDTASVVLENDARFVIEWTHLPLGGT